jgi:hypothetical protein
LQKCTALLLEEIQKQPLERAPLPRLGELGSNNTATIGCGLRRRLDLTTNETKPTVLNGLGEMGRIRDTATSDFIAALRAESNQLLDTDDGKEIGMGTTDTLKFGWQLVLVQQEETRNVVRTRVRSELIDAIVGDVTPIENRVVCCLRHG